jgi:hypothetical protein
MRDMINKGRQIHPCGSQHQFAKLTETKVKEIRELWKVGLTAIALGKRFGVRACTINHVVVRRSWKHVK